MPELPDVTVYVESLERLVAGHELQQVRVLNPFVLRTAVPPVSSVNGRKVVGTRRIGKRVVIELEGALFVVIHLMIAGRLRWSPAAVAAKGAGRTGLAQFVFDHGAMTLTEAGTKRRASIHIVEGEAALAALDPGGLEVLQSDVTAFAARLGTENHTLKRALTNPRLFSGIGNAYSDEILHRAKLSPLALTASLDDAAIARLFEATRAVLTEWTERIRGAAGDGLPEKVTAFREGMAVHGRFGEPCPACGAPVQRIVYADNEANYCARCQTGGKLLADRALSRLLRKSWPRSIDELE